MSETAAAQAIAVICQGYRIASNGHDGSLDGWAKLAIIALADYPEPVIRAVADPRIGVLAKCKFLPTIAELRECGDALAIKFRMAEHEESRRELAALRLPKPDNYDEEHLARMRRRWDGLLAEIKRNARVIDRRKPVNELTPDEEREHALAQLEALRLNPPSAPPLSPDALKTIGA